MSNSITDTATIEWLKKAKEETALHFTFPSAFAIQFLEYSRAEFGMLTLD